MDKSQFNIFQAVKKAYAFVGQEWLYLLKAGLLPMAAQAALALFVLFERPDASAIEDYLWELPATALFAGFMFIETRLLLLGERQNQLPKNTAFITDRQHALKATVLSALLVHMVLMLTMLLLLVAMQTNAVIVIVLVVFGLLSVLHFCLIPTLAAVHHPIHPVMQQLKSLLFSLRLAGVGCACLFPATIVFQLLVFYFVPEAMDPDAIAKLTLNQQATIILVTIPLPLIVTALITAGAAYTLKQVLGTTRAGKMT